MPGEQTHDHQDKARANPAAFFGDLDGDARQRKDETGPKDWNAQDVEHGVGDFG